MKERKYKEDWYNRTSFDEKTGKEKRTPVYRGDWFRLPAERTRRSLFLEALLPWIGFAVLVLAYFRINFPGTAVLYVFLPLGLSLFPALYWVMGIAALYRTPDKMTRLQKENGLGRILRSSAGCAVFSFAALLGDCIFLLTGSRAQEEWPGTLMLLLAAVLCCFTVRRFRGKDHLAVREEVSV